MSCAAISQEFASLKWGFSLFFFFFFKQGRTWTFGFTFSAAPKPGHQSKWLNLTSRFLLKDRQGWCCWSQILQVSVMIGASCSNCYLNLGLGCHPSTLWLKCLKFCPGMCAYLSARRSGTADSPPTHPLVFSNWHVFICSFIKYLLSALSEFHCRRSRGRVRQIRSLIWCLYSRGKRHCNKHVSK